MTGIKGKVGLALRVLVGVLFLAAGIAKLVGAHQMVIEFDQLGFGPWLRYSTGIAELVGVGLLVQRRTVPLGTAILMAICIGALYAQAAVLHGDIVHVIVLAAIVGWIGWSYRQSDRNSHAA
ncbi:putative membrane protein YphA (DoxX/SURF4 family) [Sphingomonas vulcanisoli]|uniref:Membrane protein YphA (DoxX/SURF4 family) n=1 Tax=Sphingomonas vulcanisoli TaxID=1658060 RepID=A0ABX0TVQ4_9SPHN|nr:DoxX family protein [Sphingomonas vulcanisoli]NIJ09622.1 putative membrane protein YphA (DoxX/SURF4 family) [Sphingomonas vulcanisoli]